MNSNIAYHRDRHRNHPSSSCQLRHHRCAPNTASSTSLDQPNTLPPSQRNTMSNAPPTYDTAVNSHSTTAAAPQVAVTDAAGHQVSQPSTTGSGNNSRNNRTRTEEDDSSDSDDDEYGSGFLHPHPAGGFHGDARKSMESMDEEYRELPDGWVRCFDPKSVRIEKGPILRSVGGSPRYHFDFVRRTQHAFYAEEKTGRTIWQHPYDDPDFLRSLPDTHPANPNSAEAKAARAKYEEQKKMAAQRGGGEGAGASAQQQQSSASTSSASTIRPPNHEKRHGVKGFTDKILGGNPDERRYKKEKRREQERVSSTSGRGGSSMVVGSGGSRGGDQTSGSDSGSERTMVVSTAAAAEESASPSHGKTKTAAGDDDDLRSSSSSFAAPSSTPHPASDKRPAHQGNGNGDRYAPMPSDPCNVQ